MIIIMLTKIKEIVRKSHFILKLFSFILILTSSACVSNNDIKYNSENGEIVLLKNPDAMIEFRSNQINGYCNDLFSGNKLLQENCKNKIRDPYFRNNLAGDQYYQKKLLRSLLISLSDRSMYYYSKKNYYEAIRDCSYADQVSTYIDRKEYSYFGLKHLYWCGMAYLAWGNEHRALSYFQTQKKLLLNQGSGTKRYANCKEFEIYSAVDEIFFSKKPWSDCKVIERIEKSTTKILEKKRAENLYAKRKREAYEKEQQRIANENRRIAEKKYNEEIARRNKENLRKRKLQQAQQKKIRQDKINRWKAHIEKERVVCPQSKSLKISNILWENIATQFGLNPNYKKYRIVESSWIYGKEDKKIEPFWELFSEPSQLRCVLKIYIDTGVCNVSVEIVKNNNAGFFNMLKGRYEFHNSNSSPCIK